MISPRETVDEIFELKCLALLVGGGAIARTMDGIRICFWAAATSREISPGIIQNGHHDFGPAFDVGSGCYD